MTASAGSPIAGSPTRRNASDLRTKREVGAVFWRARSLRVLAAFVVVAIITRILISRSFGLDDLVAVAVTLAATGTVEWFIHRHLLHAPPESTRMRVLGTGRGHREHHLRPTDLGWILLSPADVVAFVVGFVPFTAAWTAIAAVVFDVSFPSTFGSAMVLVLAGLVHYEWTHLLVHSGYRPTTRYYANLARNHRLHHFRNEGYWLGVTSNSGDRLLRTLPAKGDVERSETARSLG